MKLWFTEHFPPLICDSRPQVLVLDGQNSHNFVELLQVSQINQIIIIELPEHRSHWLQPMDRCLFGPFKKAYNYACQTLMNGHPGTVVSKTTFRGLLKKAWDSSMTETNLASGFRACGIYPADRNAIPSEAYQPSTVSVCRKTVFGTPAAEADETMDVENLATGSSGGLTVVDLNDPAVLSMLTTGTGFEELVHSNSSQSDEEDMITDLDSIPADSVHADEMALTSIEASLSHEQKRRVEAHYVAGKPLIHDKPYMTWQWYKMKKATQHDSTIPASSSSPRPEAMPASSSPPCPALPRGDARKFQPSLSRGDARKFQPSLPRGDASKFQTSLPRGDAHKFQHSSPRGDVRHFQHSSPRGDARTLQHSSHRGDARKCTQPSPGL